MSVDAARSRLFSNHTKTLGFGPPRPGISKAPHHVSALNAFIRIPLIMREEIASFRYLVRISHLAGHPKPGERPVMLVSSLVKCIWLCSAGSHFTPQV
jgi:hypothetical protein